MILMTSFLNVGASPKAAQCDSRSIEGPRQKPGHRSCVVPTWRRPHPPTLRTDEPGRGGRERKRLARPSTIYGEHCGGGHGAERPSGCFDGSRTECILGSEVQAPKRCNEYVRGVSLSFPFFPFSLFPFSPFPLFPLSPFPFSFSILFPMLAGTPGLEFVSRSPNVQLPPCSSLLRRSDRGFRSS